MRTFFFNVLGQTPIGLTKLSGNYVSAHPAIAKKPFHCSYIVAKYVQNSAQLVFG